LFQTHPSEVITSAKILFQPNVEADKQVTAAHFFDFKLRFSTPAIAPGNWNNGPAVPADDGLERDFNCEIKMGSD
jgi:hypothetical protein